LKIIGQCGIKYTIMLPIKTITSDLKVSTHINTSITACQNGLALILLIISVNHDQTKPSCITVNSFQSVDINFREYENSWIPCYIRVSK
jgi:hypothetical protein